MESELAELESELEKIDDDCDSKELVAMGQSWELLNFMASDDEEDLEVRAKAQARLVLIAKLRDKLKEYCEFSLPCGLILWLRRCQMKL